MNGNTFDMRKGALLHLPEPISTHDSGEQFAHGIKGSKTIVRHVPMLPIDRPRLAERTIAFSAAAGSFRFADASSW